MARINKTIDKEFTKLFNIVNTLKKEYDNQIKQLDELSENFLVSNQSFQAKMNLCDEARKQWLDAVQLRNDFYFKNSDNILLY